MSRLCQPVTEYNSGSFIRNLRKLNWRKNFYTQKTATLKFMADSVHWHYGVLCSNFRKTAQNSVNVSKIWTQESLPELLSFIWLSTLIPEGGWEWALGFYFRYNKYNTLSQRIQNSIELLIWEYLWYIWLLPSVEQTVLNIRKPATNCKSIWKELKSRFYILFLARKDYREYH